MMLNAAQAMRRHRSPVDAKERLGCSSRESVDGPDRFEIEAMQTHASKKKGGVAL